MDVMTVSFNANGEYMGHTAIDDHADYPHEPGTLYDCAACEPLLTPRTVYRVWHENGDFEGEYLFQGDARVAAALCEHGCTHVQTVKVYPDGSEYDATGNE